MSAAWRALPFLKTLTSVRFAWGDSHRDHCRMTHWIHQAAVTAALFLFSLAVIYGALSDIRSYTIPNRVSYGLALLFLVYAALKWPDLPLLLHLGIGLFVFVTCLIFWQLRWMGGGDVKFVAAISLWMGPQRILIFV